MIGLIREHGVQSEKWNALVIPAVHGLVKTTLPMLSAGWGISLGLVFAAAVPASFSYVNLYLWWGGVYSVVMAVAIPLVALLVAADVAAASSKCDDLVMALNDKRFEDTSVETDTKLQVLEHALEKLNRKQGMGFVVGTKVFDRITLRNMFVALASFASAVLPLIFALWSNSSQPSIWISGADVYQVPSGRFYAVSHVARNYTDALDYCTSRGMTIASIHSQADSDSLDYLLIDKDEYKSQGYEPLIDENTGEQRGSEAELMYLIGGRCLGEGGCDYADGYVGWQWEDGSPFDFKHWMFETIPRHASPSADMHLSVVKGKGWRNTASDFGLKHHAGNKHPFICGTPPLASSGFCNMISQSSTGAAWASEVGACEG